MTGAERRALCIGLAGPFPPPYGGMSTYFAVLEESIAAAGLDRREIPLRPPGEGTKLGLLRRLWSFVAVSARVLRADVDVVHCITGSQRNLRANALPLLAARLAGRPSVLSIVGGEFQEAVRTSPPARRALLRTIVSLPSLLIACNREIADGLRMLRVPERRIAVISNALPAPSGPPTDATDVDPSIVEFIESHAPLLVSVSSWHEHYGSMELLQAVDALRQRHPRIGLVLVTKEDEVDGDFERSVRDWIGRRDLAPHVLLVQNVPSVIAILRRADAFVRTPHMEGDSISVREALAVGVPVIASDVGHRPPGVVLFAPKDAIDLERKLEETLAADDRDPAVPALAAEGESNLESIIALYHELAGRRSRPT